MNAKSVLDDRSLKWLREQMALACDMSESVETMRKWGYSDEAILAGIETLRPRGNALEGGSQPPPLIRRSPKNLHRLDNPNVELYTLDDFLSPKECARLVALIGHHLHPSTLTFDPKDSAFRTSQSCYLCHLKSPVAVSIDAKICKTLGIRVEYSEGIQAQRYDVGQQFKPHWDYFQPDTDVYRRLAGVRGNRTWSFMVYLNDGMEGGATRFTRIDHAVQPKAGMALFWNNLKPDGSINEFTMHCGEPVISGHKIVITKWFRIHGHGPVFHE
jgi:prolyl 4-hydroxylase